MRRGAAAPCSKLATGAEDSSGVVIARCLDLPYSYARDEPIDVRLDLLDALTGDMFDRMFAVIDGMLAPGLEPGRVRAFSVGTATAPTATGSTATDTIDN